MALPDPVDLSFFVTLCQHSSLAAAAQALGVSAPAVSRRLAALESRLGVRLLNRTTRRQSLTPEGERYLADGSRILRDLQALEQDLAAAREQPRGLLRISASFGFGRRHIAPVIADFVRRYPEVEVLLRVADRPLDLAAAGMDVGIRFGVDPDSPLVARKIAANHRMVCAAPAYLREGSEPAHPRDLREHQCIDIRENDQTHGLWTLVRGEEQVAVKVHGMLATNHGEVGMDWALKGLGVALRSRWDVAPYLRSGALVRLLPEWSGVAADIYAVYPRPEQPPAKLRLFLDFLADRFADYRVSDAAW